MNLRALVTNHNEERTLIEAAQRDPARFAELYEQNFERVYAYFAHRVHDRSDAEDLTAEVFREALAGIGGFEWRGAPFAAWLLGIAGHVLADRWRKLKQTPPADEDALENAAVHDEVEQRAMLFQLVGRLPEDQRLVIVRRFVEQRSIREIARELGRSEGAIKQLQFRALQTLRAQARATHD